MNGDALVFEHNGYTLRVTKGHGGADSGVSVFLRGNPYYPGGLPLRDYRVGMTRAEVRALAIAASDKLDEYQRKRAESQRRPPTTGAR